MGTCGETICKHRIPFPSIQHLAILVENRQQLRNETVAASDQVRVLGVTLTVTIRFHVSYNIVLGSDGYLYILSHFGCLPNASLDWPV